uniref:Uncharacterized protein n=1 Tax=Arundo donax TaxID=35708 RepID=A0A0A8Z4B3_ARUDO
MQYPLLHIDGNSSVLRNNQLLQNIKQRKNDGMFSYA